MSDSAGSDEFTIDTEHMPVDSVDELVNEIVAAINRPQQGSLDPDDGGYLPPLDLPGFGEPYPDCGEDIVHFCDQCADIVGVGRTCDRSVCERCAQSWVLDPAIQVTAKADSTARLMSSKLGGVSVKKHHVVISPPDDWYLAASEPLDKTFEVIKEILAATGAEGASFYHGWAGNEEQDTDIGQWKERLFAGRDWETDVRQELMPRPHFHLLVVCPFFPGQSVTDRVHSETGWVIHRVADEETGGSLDSLKKFAKAATYCPSHTSIDTRGDGYNRAQIRKFGSTWHDASVYDNQLRKAEYAVRSVAPKTLGIPAREIRCESTGGDSEDGIELLDEYTSSSDLDDDHDDHDCGDSCDDDHNDHDDDREPDEREMCKGALVPISEAPGYLDDDSWIEDCPHTDRLREAYQDFQDQSQLDNPPPMVSAFC